MFIREVAALAIASLLAAASPPPPVSDWSAALRTDASAFHDDVAANHPGPVNPLDPQFAARNDAALKVAMRRAARVTDRAGYMFALDGYAAAFDDGHVAIYPPDSAAPLPARWPGFLTGFDGAGVQRVMTRADAATPPLGARLLSCGGRSADRLAADNIGAFEGRWFLTSRRMLRGGRLFVDQGNPFIRRPRRCAFEVSGMKREVTLDWRPITPEALRARLAESNGRAHEPIGARVLADGTRWFTLSGFDGDPASADGKALPPLIAAMRADRGRIAAAPRIVLDLRGNNGGSSDWSRQIAVILWGEAAVSRFSDGSNAVDWRASAANIAWLTAIRDQRRSVLSPEALGWFDRSLAGMRAAQAQSRPLWRDMDDQEPPSTASAPSALAGPVYIVTDAGCGSACLDAADLWRAMGAIQVGQETGADTFYMDVREATLPSGQASYNVPMKVYRGRTRGSNQPLTPRHVYSGDLRDTAALEHWIAALPSS